MTLIGISHPSRVNKPYQEPHIVHVKTLQVEQRIHAGILEKGVLEQAAAQTQNYHVSHYLIAISACQGNTRELLSTWK